MTRGYTPTTLAEALAILGDAELGAVPIAGCTDLMVVDTATRRTHPAVVDLLRIDALRGIRRDGDWIDFGAAATFSELRHDPLVRAHLPILAEMAATIGGWQIQARATIGGNIANASPAGDSLPLWLVLGAELVLAGPRGERIIAYDDMHIDYRRTALMPGELIVRVRVPMPVDGTRHLFRKVGTREAQAISKVVVAGAARVGDVLDDVRFAAGSVAAVPVRLAAVEAFCEGRAAGPELALSACEIARKSVEPIDDVRSTSQYRSFALGRVIRRMILDFAAG